MDEVPSDPKAPDHFALPFKPFSPQEVVAITGVPGTLLDDWVLKGVVPVCTGEGVTGLDFLCSFAVYVGWRYKAEGADPSRVRSVVKFLVDSGLATIVSAIRAGQSFASPPTTAVDPKSPFPTTVPGCFVQPPKSRLGKALDLRTLYAEFTNRVNRQFPGILNDFPRLAEKEDN